MSGEFQTKWGGSLHTTFRLLPTPSPQLRPFLESEGATAREVLGRLPYHRARSRGAGRGGPDPKRYRDYRQVYETIGLLYEGDDERIHVTGLGKAVVRWLDILTKKNIVILGRHAAYALAACQLRNPTKAGRKYETTVNVFPFAFIWRAMLALDRRISSDELNRAIFKVRNESELDEAIRTIAQFRKTGDLDLMGEETISGTRKDDRVIPWVSLASFGWSLISDKREASTPGYYEIPTHTVDLLREASSLRRRHREFGSMQEYIESVMAAAALPKDLR